MICSTLCLFTGTATPSVLSELQTTTDEMDRFKGGRPRGFPDKLSSPFCKNLGESNDPQSQGRRNDPAYLRQMDNPSSRDCHSLRPALFA
jgi:hypothetical protein